MDAQRLVTIVLADDHPVFRKGLRDIINEEKRFQVVGEAGDGAQVLPQVQCLKPDVLLLDLNMPGCHGLDIAARMRDLGVEVRTIVLTMHKEEPVFNRAMDLGVMGYVLKECAATEILDSINAVMEERYYISPAISHYLVNRRAGKDALLHNTPGLDSLSPTERRILRLIAEQKTSREIGDLLFISVRTVENHRMNICNKLTLHGSNAVLKFALENKSAL
jgi:DNA-binding NarL/FixJ family response regulator